MRPRRATAWRPRAPPPCGGCCDRHAECWCQWDGAYEYNDESSAVIGIFVFVHKPIIALAIIVGVVIGVAVSRGKQAQASSHPSPHTTAVQPAGAMRGQIIQASSAQVVGTPAEPYSK